MRTVEDTNLVCKLLVRSGLTCRECEVVLLYTTQEHTFKEIGIRYGVSVERCRQIYHKALRKMRRKCTELKAGSYTTCDTEPTMWDMHMEVG